MSLAWLDEIEARCNAATPGPWTGFDYDAAARNYRIRVHTGPTSDVWREATMEDFELIFRAPIDVPRLCRAVRELYSELSRLVMAVKHDQQYGWHNASTYDAEKALERWQRCGEAE